MEKHTEQMDYLAVDSVVDWQHPALLSQATKLARGANDSVELARRCYLFVRDEIDHSFDISADAVTCSASSVLQAGHGICYAKSHLLAALLRANGIAAGFSYQRLADEEMGHVLHGYNTVQLPQHGWYRVDARGNTGDIDARFEPPRIQLAFSTEAPGEVDYNLNLATPPRAVVRALQQSNSVAQLRQLLPRSVSMG